MTTAQEIAIRKAELRREMRARRDALPSEERAAWTAAIAERVLALSEVRAARVVHGFLGIGSEVGTEALMRTFLERGVRVVFPRVAPGRVLEHLEVRDLDSMVAGPMGLREPDPRVSAPVDLAEVEVMLVPGLAFDLGGYRVGYGGGYYDRVLAELSSRGAATTIGIAFEVQVVDEVPREAHDLAVQVLVTERRTMVIEGA
jgi:5-formyltetrahydrofolate cyclo-ligase